MFGCKQQKTQQKLAQPQGDLSHPQRARARSKAARAAQWCRQGPKLSLRLYCLFTFMLLIYCPQDYCNKVTKWSLQFCLVLVLRKQERAGGYGDLLEGTFSALTDQGFVAQLPPAARELGNVVFLSYSP